MSLSTDLISQFVKATNDTEKPNNETTVFGTTVMYDGRLYVKLDGSDLLTPVSSTTDAGADERVTVLIKNHSATVTGNISYPAAKQESVKEVATKITEVEVVMAYKVTTENLEAINATIESLKATTAHITNADIIYAEIVELQAKYAELEYVNAKDVEALNAIIENLEAEFGKFTDISTEDLEAINADIANLKGYNADFTYVSADVLTAFKANIEKLETDKLSAKEAELVFANIDFSNIGEAAVEKLFADSGIIKDLVMSDGNVTGELVGVTIKGDLIEANTLRADKLVVKGEDGLYYKLNIDGGALTSDEVTTEMLQNGLSGSVIIARSITAEKVAVDDLVAFNATIGGFHITDHSIYSGAKASADNTTQGVYMDDEGQFSVGDSENFFRYFKDENGNYKLEVSAGSILFGTSHKSVETVIQEIEDNVTANTDAIEGVSSNVIEVSKELSTSIAHTEEGIISRVQSEFYNRDETDTLIDSIGTQLVQAENSWEMQFLGMAENISELSYATNTEFGVIKDYIRFEDGNIILGKTGNELKLNISNDRISFLQGSNEVAYMSNSKLYITDAEILASLRIGKFAFIPRSNGSLDFKKMG